MGAAALVAWAVLAATVGGGDGGEDEETATPATTTTEAPFERTTTTRPRTTTTQQVIAGAPLLGERAGLSLVVVSDASRILDLDTGSVRRLPRTANVLVSSGGRLLVSTGVRAAWWPAPFDGSGAVELEVANVDQAWADADGGPLWLASSRGPDLVVSVVDTDGALLAERVLPHTVWPFGNVDGGLVLRAPGGTFLVDVAGAVTQLSNGEPVAVGGDRVYVNRCDEELLCGFEVVDLEGRVIEERRNVEDFAGVWNFGAIISSTGRIAQVIESPTSDGMVVAIDADPAFEVSVDGVNTMTWTPDGRWLIVSTGIGDLEIVDSSSGATYEVEGVAPLGNQPPWALYVVATGK